MFRRASRTPRTEIAAVIALVVGCMGSPPGRATNSSGALEEAVPLRIEFRLAQEIPKPGWQPYKEPVGGATIYVSDHVEMSGADFNILGATAVTGGVILELAFTDASRERFAALTAQNLEKRLAIFLDGALVGAPIIRDRIAGHAPVVVMANVTPDEAARIVTLVSRQ